MFKNWYVSQKFNNATNLSHVLMDGGKLSVPFDRLNEFYDKYIEAVKSREKLYVVEQKSDTYNFFVDIDYKSPEALGIDEIKDICKVICDEVKKHGGGESLISIAQPKKCGELIKTGVHLNWSGFVVDQSSAIALREYILVALSRYQGDVIWDDIIDSSVYGNEDRKTKGSGFRMPWSFKKAKHDACSGRGCSGCDNGKVDQVEYLPLFIYTQAPFSTLMRIDPEPSVKILKMSAVRTDAPQNIHVETPNVRVVRKEGSFTSDEMKDEVYDEELKLLLESFIRKNLEGQGDAYLTKLFRYNGTYRVATNSKYCENLKRKHGSNHIWFTISGKELAQKCFCDCPTLVGRRDGLCRFFVGRQHTLPPNIVDRLYPKKEDIGKCPKIKKYEEKPQVKQSDVNPQLQQYINKFMKTTGDVRITRITQEKDTFMVLTASSYCENIGGVHDDNTMMSYSIDKKHRITQKCPICKGGKKNRARTHQLTNDVVKVLKQ